MWLQKDEYDATHKDKPLGIVCEYPVYSIKQRNLIESMANGNVPRSAVQSRAPALSSRQGSVDSVTSVTGSSLTNIRCSVDNVRDNGNGDSAQSLSKDVYFSGEAEREAGGVRTILNILDNFKLEDIKKDDGRHASSDADGNHQSITVVESSLTQLSSAARAETLKDKKGALNAEECLINGMSQGDRLQHIKAMRQHARSTTTGALRCDLKEKSELLINFKAALLEMKTLSSCEVLKRLSKVLI